MFDPTTLLDRACVVLTRVHGWLARWVGGTIGRVWTWQARRPLAPKFTLGFLALAGIAFALARFVPVRFYEWASLGEAQMRLIEKIGANASAGPVHAMLLIASVVCLVAAAAAWIRRAFAFRVMQAAWAFFAVAGFAALRWVFDTPAAMVLADYKLFDKLSRNAVWTAALGVMGPVVILMALVLLGLLMSSTREHYRLRTTAQKKADAADLTRIGDNVVESLRTGGRDPRYRTSTYWSAGLFLFVIILPFLLHGCGWEEPYGLVQGSGEPEVQVVKIKKIKKEKKKKYILNAWSPYIFERAKIDDMKTFEDMQQETMDTYVAESTQAKGGKLGKGGGKTGGWPKGMENAKVRFIRLEYKGGDWDQDMGKGSDYNLLLRFHAITGFPIAGETESKSIDRLRRFPKNYAPPFVFLTGSGNINVSQSEIETLRWYLTEEGGMLFIDNGGGHFGNSVRQLISRIFPGQSMVDISNDDPIFRQPYIFPDGAPPFWHHDGNRARGVRVGDRLAVFYHPGDVNDAWKDGHSGASKQVAEQAYQLGVNVMYYAFNAYYERHFEDGKEKK